jgi:hypothetical protein
MKYLQLITLTAVFIGPVGPAHAKQSWLCNIRRGLSARLTKIAAPRTFTARDGTRYWMRIPRSSTAKQIAATRVGSVSDAFRLLDRVARDGKVDRNEAFALTGTGRADSWAGTLLRSAAHKIDWTIDATSKAARRFPGEGMIRELFGGTIGAEGPNVRAVAMSQAQLRRGAVDLAFDTFGVVRLLEQMGAARIDPLGHGAWVNRSAAVAFNARRGAILDAAARSPDPVKHMRGFFKRQIKGSATQYWANGAIE